MKNNERSSKGILIKVVLSILFIMILLYTTVSAYSYTVISDYENKIYPNVYVNDYDISKIDKEEVVTKVDFIAQNIESKNITLVVNGKEYTYIAKDLGVFIDKDNLSNKILTYSNDMNSFDKLKSILRNQKIVFDYEVSCSNDKIKKILEELKKKVDTKVVEGKLVMGSDRVLSYKKGTPSFSLDIDKSSKIIEEKLNDLLSGEKAELVGTSQNPKEDSLSKIDTKVSSFSTTYNAKVSRATNIATAASYIDGVILEPGEVFSFFKYAGPYGKKGYVYYDGAIGNGVCQVASTIYNTQLLAGLKTIERYSHEKQMIYVEGGLDATVASIGNRSKVDFKFKNTYDYPIYISAYTNKGTLTIEFWSNSKAKKGKTYKTQSVKIGYKGYKTYLLTYENGKQTNKEFIATTWYPK